MLLLSTPTNDVLEDVLLEFTLLMDRMIAELVELTVVNVVGALVKLILLDGLPVVLVRSVLVKGFVTAPVELCLELTIAVVVGFGFSMVTSGTVYV